jgi:hypothetical protein
MNHLKLSFVFFLLFFCQLASAWTLEHDKHGIQIFTKAMAGSSFKAFRGTVTVNTSLLNVVAHHVDLQAMPEWLQDCRKSELISEVNGRDFYLYQQTDAPWPVADRDYVLHMQFEQDPETYVVLITFEATQAFNKSDKDCVPITELSGYWRFTPKTENQVLIEYETYADPAGDIPSWLANAFVVDQPLGTLKKLRKRLQNHIYSLPETFSYIKSPQ